MLTKLGWFDLEEFKTVHRDLNQFLQVILRHTPPPPVILQCHNIILILIHQIQASIDHRIVGLQLLTILVQDINLPIPARNLARHRKTGKIPFYIP
jgi:hypothetical protein